MTRPDEREDLARRGDPPVSGRPGGRPDRGGRMALALGIPGIILSVVFFPLGLVLDVAAIALGVRTLRNAGRARNSGHAAGATAGIVCGAIGALLAAIMLTLLVFFWQEARSYQECMSGANTISSEQTCMTEFEEAIRERLGLLTTP